MLVANPVLHARTKHFEIDLYFVREKVLNKTLEVKNVLVVAKITGKFTNANKTLERLV